MNDKSLERKLRSRTARIAVVGLGYAGLPMAVEFARAGFPVVGFDVAADRVDAVVHGHSPVSNVADGEIAALREADQLTASADARVLDSADVAVLCVPTPLNADGGPDLHFVESAGVTIANHLHPGMLVVLQSTCGPRTTSDLLCPILEERSRLRAGEDFFLVFAPERIDPGNTRFGVKNTPKLVGGLTPESTRLACLLYEACIDEVVPVSSPEVAEMAKLVENTFRFINISFVNEMALLCDRLGVNVWEVIEAAKTKPFAFMPHYPSPGVGGHCIPVVPQYLDAAEREQGLSSELIPAANRINFAMPRLVVDKLEQALAAAGRRLPEAHVLLIGVTYKPDVADIRESAAVRVLQAAVSRGATVSYHDPLTPSLSVDTSEVCSGPLDSSTPSVAQNGASGCVPRNGSSRSIPSNGSSASAQRNGPVLELRSVSLEPSTVAAADAVVLLTPHTTIDYDRIVRNARLVIDTHSGLHPREAPNVVNVWVPATADRGIRVSV
ncbi:MAG: nucleotide sugar dehydrogenase [Chloroflexi bacterium]|nr:nucleotide sugar dehydrogenase [Chloroflexota bacterium]